MTYPDIHMALLQQIRDEEKEFYDRIKQDLDKMKQDEIANGSFDQEKHEDYARRLTQWKEKHEPPRHMHELNCSGQHQLALYVRKDS